MRPVNNIVDITNYVMHELGQPLHAYDLEHLSGHYLEARRARSGEKLVTIDERERTLSEDVLVIADRQNIVGIAGVMGGKGSEIACNTTAIALEAASFESARVRRSSRCLGLSSDSSLRFERGVDVASVRRASDRAAFLMTKHCGAQVQTLSTAGQDRVQPLTVMLRMSEIARLTELDMMPDTVADLLTPLGFKVHSDTPWDPRNPKVYVDVPSFRRKDVSREVDLVEEVCRLWGYDQVPQSMPRNTIAPSCPDNTLKLVGQALTAAGLSEAWISSLTALEDLNSKGAFGADTAGAVRVLNPLSEEHQVLRQSLIPGLLKAVAYNLDRGRPDVWLFETGRVYIKEFTPASSSKETGTKESLHVSAIVCGQSALSSWNKQTGEVGSEGDFYTAKGIVENLLGHLGVPATRLTFSKDPSVPGWFHPARSCCITWGMSSNGKSEMQSLGFLGQVHPAVADAYGLKKQASIFELNIGSIIAALAARRFEEIHTTPFVIRDLSADVDNNQAYDPVLKCITRCAGDLLKHAELVSIFQLPDNKKSLSFRLSFQHRQDTLTAEVVENILDKVRRRLTEELSATFRA